MFWVPNGWVPGYVEWVLSFPRAPLGSVSIQVWGIACASVINLVSQAVVAVYALRNGQAEEKKEAMAFGAGVTADGNGTGTPKKEL